MDVGNDDQYEETLTEYTGTSNNLANQTIQQDDIQKKIPWYNRCLYSCQHCSKQYFENKYLKNHIENNHENYNEYEQKFGELSSIRNNHECEECGKGVVWSKQNIEKHITNQHNLTLEAYYERNKSNIELPVMNILDRSLLGQSKR